MKVAIYSTHLFEREYLQKANNGQHELLLIDSKLNTQTAQLAKGCPAVSIFDEHC